MDITGDTQFNPRDTEALQAASRELGEAEEVRVNDIEILSRGEQTSNHPQSDSEEYDQLTRSLLSKLVSVEKELKRVDQGLVEIEASLVSLVEKKKELEEAKDELSRIREKYAALDMEVGRVLMRHQKS